MDDLRDKDANGCDTLLGVVGTKVIVSGEEDVICFDWQKYDIDAADKQASWLWQEEVTPIRGRSFVTTDSVFIPTTTRLYRHNLANGKAVDAYPPAPRVWEEGRRAGQRAGHQRSCDSGGSQDG